MCLKIRCDGKSKKKLQNFLRTKQALAKTKIPFWRAPPVIPGHFEFLILMRIPHQTPSPPPVVSRHSSPRLTGPLVGAQIYPTPSRLRSAMDDSAGEAGSQSQVRRIRGASLSSAPQPLSRSKYGTRRSNPSRPLAYPRFLSLQVHACSSYPLSFPSRAFPSSLCLSRI
jgi:hypothetical protein